MASCQDIWHSAEILWEKHLPVVSARPRAYTIYIERNILNGFWFTYGYFRVFATTQQNGHLGMLVWTMDPISDMPVDDSLIGR
eukprot:scaffold331784_cov35-Prasinocladus_malaysianus.AAC.3